MEHVRKPKLRFLAPVLESASLYKLVGLGLFIVVFSAVSGLWLLIGTRRSYADWGALVATLCTTSVIFVLSRLERLAGVDQAEHDPVLRRAKRLMIIGFALAVVLAGGLSINNALASRSNDKFEQDGRTRREMLGALERDSGNNGARLTQLQQQRERAGAPATTQSTAK